MSVLESRRALALYVAAGAAFSAIAARGVLVPLYAHDMGASRFEVGALFSVATLAGALLSLPSGLLIDRFGSRNLLWTALILSAGSQLATATSTSVFPLFVWQIVGGLGGGAQQASLFSAVTETVPANPLRPAEGRAPFSLPARFLPRPPVPGLPSAR